MKRDNSLGPEDRPGPPSVRDPAGFIGSAILPAIPLGLVLAAAGHWLFAEPLLVWAGLIVAAANLLFFAGFVLWYRRREQRRLRDWQAHVWQHGEDKGEDTRDR